MRANSSAEGALCFFLAQPEQKLFALTPPGVGAGQALKLSHQFSAVEGSGMAFGKHFQKDQSCFAEFLAVSAMRRDSTAFLSSTTLTTELSRIQFH